MLLDHAQLALDKAREAGDLQVLRLRCAVPGRILSSLETMGQREAL